MDNKIVLRKVFPEIKSHLKDEEITIIIGPRQVGKTTLLLQLKEELTKSGSISPREVYYFNLDVVTDQTIFKNQADFIQFVKNRVLEKDKKLYIFVDEAQRIENTGLFFKGVFDLKLPLKLILTGSSTLEIRSKITEPLTGRKRIFKLLPLSFKEYLSSENEELLPFLTYEDKYAKVKLLEYLSSFIIWGGYPKVILEKDLEKKTAYLEDIFQSYLEKDVVGFLRIKDSFIFSKVVKIMAEEIGNLFNITNTSNQLGIKHQTLKNYLDILEKTFVLKRLLPFFRSTRTEIRKMPKLYFYDTGLRNFTKEGKDLSWKEFKDRNDKGQLLENFIFSELIKSEIENVNFWRTKDEAEIDFVIQKKGEVIPVEVKAIELGKKLLPRSFLSFISKYHPKLGIVISLKKQSTRKYLKTEIHSLLPFELTEFLTGI